MTSTGRQRVRDDRENSTVEQRLIEAVTRGEVLDLAGLAISAAVIRDLLRGRLGGDADPHGLRLRGARIDGRVDLENVTSDLALELHECVLPGGVDLRNAALRSVALVGCRISAAPGDVPVDATRLAARTLSLEGSTVDGTVRLLAARLGTLDCGGARLRNPDGPAVDADGMQVEQSVFLRDGFSAVSASERGTVRLLGATVGGQLNCGGTRLENTVGPALNADNLSVKQNVLLRNGFKATSAGEQGTIRLIGAHVGSLSWGGARLTNAAGPALDADGLVVDGNAFLDDGFTASAVSGAATIRLPGARIGGVLDCGGAHLANTAGPALDAGALQITHDLILANGFTATAAGDDAVLLLTGTHVGGALYLDTDGLTGAAPALVDLDGLTYTGLPRPAAAERWLTLLRSHTPGYAAHAYQQLAAAYRTVGHDRDARAVLIAQRRDHLARAGLTWSERAWGHITGATLGYGWQPWRALLLLLATLAAAVTLSVVAAHHNGLAAKPTPPTTLPAGGKAVACSTIDQVGVGLDLGTPLIKTGARDRCQPTDTTMGQLVTVAGWVLQLLAWTFATLFIAGFTSAVRKT
ncbi:hypothetical protein [Asanoa siamensis]|nr:hypothetical protein [Asanoa siamensis]